MDIYVEKGREKERERAREKERERAHGDRETVRAGDNEGTGHTGRATVRIAVMVTSSPSFLSILQEKGAHSPPPRIADSSAAAGASLACRA